MGVAKFIRNLRHVDNRLWVAVSAFALIMAAGFIGKYFIKMLDRSGLSGFSEYIVLIAFFPAAVLCAWLIRKLE